MKLSRSEFFFMESFYFEFGEYNRPWDRPGFPCLHEWALLVVLLKKQSIIEEVRCVGIVVNDTLLTFSMSIGFVVMSPLILNIVDLYLFLLVRLNIDQFHWKFSKNQLLRFADIFYGFILFNFADLCSYFYYLLPSIYLAFNLLLLFWFLKEV